ncbi:energy-coupling factor transporter transmembrane component T family protein [Arthrobacter castelli]|uniref:energy-coupling factor transporter transmembrane component T family protein n=1 Tax=Arthrobacter castelli TaxID=271431 RepID=UPI0004217465|nr:energy-coupling factor transporter transmembrane component T [Arthrobacter castelli]
MAGHAHLLGSYTPGDSPVHRAPLWLKFTGVVLASALVLTVQQLPVTAVVLLGVISTCLLAGLKLTTALRPVLTMAPVLLVLGAYQWWLHDPVVAAVVVLNILSCVLAARLIPLTTPGQRLLDGMVSAAKPFRLLGADPERFGLTLSLMIRSIPYLLGSVSDVRDAARARGLERSPRALLVPVVINAVAYAKHTGEALAARGLGEKTGSGPEPDQAVHPGKPGGQN